MGMGEGGVNALAKTPNESLPVPSHHQLHDILQEANPVKVPREQLEEWFENPALQACYSKLGAYYDVGATSPVGAADIAALEKKVEKGSSLYQFIQMLSTWLGSRPAPMYELFVQFLKEGTGPDAIKDFSITGWSSFEQISSVREYYYDERMFQFHALRELFGIADESNHSHPYHEAATKLIKRLSENGLADILLDEYERLHKSSIPDVSKSDLENTLLGVSDAAAKSFIRDHQIAWTEQCIHEQVQLLETLLLFIFTSHGCKSKFILRMLRVFDSHAFGASKMQIAILSSSRASVAQAIHRFPYLMVLLFVASLHIPLALQTRLQGHHKLEHPLIEEDSTDLKLIHEYIMNSVLQHATETIQSSMGVPPHSMILLSWATIAKLLVASKHAEDIMTEDQVEKCAVTANHLGALSYVSRCISTLLDEEDHFTTVFDVTDATWLFDVEEVPRKDWRTSDVDTICGSLSLDSNLVDTKAEWEMNDALQGNLAVYKSVLKELMSGLFCAFESLQHMDKVSDIDMLCTMTSAIIKKHPGLCVPFFQPGESLTVLLQLSAMFFPFHANALLTLASSLVSNASTARHVFDCLGGRELMDMCTLEVSSTPSLDVNVVQTISTGNASNELPFGEVIALNTFRYANEGVVIPKGTLGRLMTQPKKGHSDGHDGSLASSSTQLIRWKVSYSPWQVFFSRLRQFNADVQSVSWNNVPLETFQEVDGVLELLTRLGMFAPDVMDQVAYHLNDIALTEWLTTRGLVELIPTLLSHGIEMNQLTSLTEEDFIQMNVNSAALRLHFFRCVEEDHPMDSKQKAFSAVEELFSILTETFFVAGRAAQSSTQLHRSKAYTQGDDNQMTESKVNNLFYGIFTKVLNVLGVCMKQPKNVSILHRCLRHHENNSSSSSSSSSATFKFSFLTLLESMRFVQEEPLRRYPVTLAALQIVSTFVDVSMQQSCNVLGQLFAAPTDTFSVQNFISRDDFIARMQAFDERISSKALSILFDAIDERGDGAFSFQDFWRFVENHRVTTLSFHSGFHRNESQSDHEIAVLFIKLRKYVRGACLDQEDFMLECYDWVYRIFTSFQSWKFSRYLQRMEINYCCVKMYVKLFTAMHVAEKERSVGDGLGVYYARCSLQSAWMKYTKAFLSDSTLLDAFYHSMYLLMNETPAMSVTMQQPIGMSVHRKKKSLMSVAQRMRGTKSVIMLSGCTNEALRPKPTSLFSNAILKYFSAHEVELMECIVRHCYVILEHVFFKPTELLGWTQKGKDVYNPQARVQTAMNEDNEDHDAAAAAAAFATFWEEKRFGILTQSFPRKAPKPTSSWYQAQEQQDIPLAPWNLLTLATFYLGYPIASNDAIACAASRALTLICQTFIAREEIGWLSPGSSFVLLSSRMPTKYKSKSKPSSSSLWCNTSLTTFFPEKETWHALRATILYLFDCQQAVPSIRVHLLNFLSMALQTQPAFAWMLFNFNEASHDDVESSTKSDLALQSSLLSTLLALLADASTLLIHHPEVLNALMSLLNVMWQGMAQGFSLHSQLVNVLCEAPTLWTQLTHSLTVSITPASTSTRNDDASHSYRLSCRTHALRILAIQWHYESGKSKTKNDVNQAAFQALFHTFRKQGLLVQWLEEFITFDYRPELTVALEKSANGLGVDLARYRRTILYPDLDVDPGYGPNFVFDVKRMIQHFGVRGTSAMKTQSTSRKSSSREDSTMNSPTSIALLAAFVENVRQANLEWSFADAQLALLQSWRLFMEVCCLQAGEVDGREESTALPHNSNSNSNNSNNNSNNSNHGKISLNESNALVTSPGNAKRSLGTTTTTTKATTAFTLEAEIPHSPFTTKRKSSSPSSSPPPPPGHSLSLSVLNPALAGEIAPLSSTWVSNVSHSHTTSSCSPSSRFWGDQTSFEITQVIREALGQETRAGFVIAVHQQVLLQVFVSMLHHQVCSVVQKVQDPGMSRVQLRTTTPARLSWHHSMALLNMLESTCNRMLRGSEVMVQNGLEGEGEATSMNRTHHLFASAPSRELRLLLQKDLLTAVLLLVRHMESLLLLDSKDTSSSSLANVFSSSSSTPLCKSTCNESLEKLPRWTNLRGKLLGHVFESLQFCQQLQQRWDVDFVGGKTGKGSKDALDPHGSLHAPSSADPVEALQGICVSLLNELVVNTASSNEEMAMISRITQYLFELYSGYAQVGDAHHSLQLLQVFACLISHGCVAYDFLHEGGLRLLYNAPVFEQLRGGGECRSNQSFSTTPAEERCFDSSLWNTNQTEHRGYRTRSTGERCLLHESWCSMLQICTRFVRVMQNVHLGSKGAAATAKEVEDGIAQVFEFLIIYNQVISSALQSLFAEQRLITLARMEEIDEIASLLLVLQENQHLWKSSVVMPKQLDVFLESIRVLLRDFTLLLGDGKNASAHSDLLMQMSKLMSAQEMHLFHDRSALVEDDSSKAAFHSHMESVIGQIQLKCILLMNRKTPSIHPTIVIKGETFVDAEAACPIFDFSPPSLSTWTSSPSLGHLCICVQYCAAHLQNNESSLLSMEEKKSNSITYQTLLLRLESAIQLLTSNFLLHDSRYVHEDSYRQELVTIIVGLMDAVCNLAKANSALDADFLVQLQDEFIRRTERFHPSFTRRSSYKNNVSWRLER